MRAAKTATRTSGRGKTPNGARVIHIREYEGRQQSASKSKLQGCECTGCAREALGQFTLLALLRAAVLLCERATERGRSRGCCTRCRAETIDRAGNRFGYKSKPARNQARVVNTDPSQRTTTNLLSALPPIVSGDGRGLS